MEIGNIKLPDLPIGREIRNFMKRSHYSAAWLAQKMCCDRTNIYKLLARRKMDTLTLYKLSFFLRHDFFAHLSAIFAQLQAQPHGDNGAI